ncbi:MAG TPA: response regulator transcription factor [Anaerolineales bacterium]|nr:response regulator transcription factor [Anaerolineales bacterium]HNC09856.1 response regulator transcription factor [Anaerolineales bacterium]
MKQINILIADDHPMMREALRTAFEDEPDLIAKWEASNGAEAVALAEEFNPDVILIDLLMPELDGLGAVQQIMEKNPQARIMVVTSLEDEEKVIAAVQAGALGYFPKTAPRSFLLEGIRRVADGVPYLPSGITQKLFNGLRKMKTVPLLERSAMNEPLTGRQEEILALLGEGLSDAVIGHTLHLSEATVRSHVHNILQRLGLETRAQAVAYANQRGKQSG